MRVRKVFVRAVGGMVLALTVPLVGVHAQTLDTGAPTTSGQTLGYFPYPTTDGIGQSFVALGTTLNSFQFHVGEVFGINLISYAGYVTDFAGNVIGTQRYLSSNQVATAVTTPPYFTAAFTPNIAVTPGQLYFAYLYPTNTFNPGGNSNYGAAMLTSGDTYAAGAGYRIVNGSLLPLSNAVVGADFSFQATFTSAATTTPEPATLALLAGGLGVFGIVASRRRRRTR